MKNLFDVDIGKVLNRFPFTSKESCIANDDDGLQLVLPKARCSQRHDEVAKTHQRRVLFAKGTQHHVVLQALQNIAIFIMRL
jgi:hypothetical protein